MHKKETLYIIDGSSLIYRAFHAIPQTFTTSKGLPTNAIYGFTQSLRKIINDFKPEYIGIAFDVKGPSFRHELFVDYKAERPPMPEPLSLQIPYIKRMVRAFNIPVLEKNGFEADDIIATLVKKMRGKDIKISLITGDKDMYQLVDDSTVILDYLTGKEYGAAEVEEKFGVGPEKIRDLLGLAGDTSDNIPGVPKVGVKTAARLLKQFGAIEDVFENITGISGEKLKENLKNFKDQALLSRELATLHPDVPFECSLEDLKYTGPDFKTLEALLNELEFKKILKELMPELPKTEEEGADYRTVLTEEDLNAAMDELRGQGRFSVSLLMTEDGFGGRLKGVALGLNPKKAFYMPAVNSGPALIPESSLTRNLKAIMEDASVKKDTDNSKSLFIYFSKNGIEAGGVEMDTSIASYLLNPSKPDHSIDALAYEHLGTSTKEEEAGDLEAFTKIYCKKACNIITISEMLDKKLEEESLKKLYLEMELPLSRVLADMEIKGIKINTGLLRDLSKEMEVELSDIEGRIYASAGMTFNINSPKQLSELLFDRLKLKPVKKTKTGFSTDEEVLTQLAAKHEVPQLIINFRQLAKLKSTYVDALLQILNPETGRVHTSFNQTVTATGRLSSSRPNLQNIPVRGEAAGRIREAFIAAPGFTFLSADYSQIELRIVAHMSEDPVLIDSFNKDEDIHTRTASEIFGIMPELVNPEMRRRAKAINFGIIYGMGPYGLSAELGISMKEAIEYINRYFEHYRSVKRFIDKTVEEAAVRGYTVTLFGRRRFIPELKSQVEQIARLGNRLAINTPIQGSAADMIKAAMIRIHRLLGEGSYSSRMILQIHDELVFEVEESEKEAVAALVKKEMEGVISLKVPVRVNLKSGANWRTVE